MRISDWSSDVCSSDLEGLLQRRGDDAGTGGLVGGLELLDESQHLLLGPQQGGAAAGDHALLDSRLGGAHGVLDAVLLLLELDLRGGADLEDGDTTGQLGEALLELLAVVVRVGVLDLVLDLLDAALDRSEENTSELQSLMSISYDVFCL